MGLGGAVSEWADYEWVRLADLPSNPLGARLCDRLDELPVWADDAGSRVLLVDLDNLRASPQRWQGRMDAVVHLARGAEHVVLAGQHGAVARGRVHLAEFADRTRAVADGSDLADYELLDALAVIERDADAPVQVVVLSNDGIFADIARRSRLVVLSPGADALSDRLRDAAEHVVDLTALERARTGRRSPANGSARGSASAPATSGRRPAAKKAAATKAAAKKAAAKTSASGTTAKKTAAKKTSTSGTTTRKAATKQPAAKSALKKSTAKQTAADPETAPTAPRPSPRKAAAK